MPPTAKITAASIEALLPFLDEFEKSGFEWGTWCFPESEEPGVIVAPYYSSSELVSSFTRTLYKNGWIQPFDWVEWQVHADKFVDAPELVESADLETIRKLFTTHIRCERFCEGHLACMFEKGHIVALLRRLKQISGNSRRS